jgi:hypothetical protein
LIVRAIEGTVFAAQRAAMALQIKREGATPNLLKYSVVADKEGGEVIIRREDLIRDTANGPLRKHFERGVRVGDAETACRYLLCNPSMRTLVTPQTFSRVAVNATAEGPTADIALKITAEPNAIAIVALEFRHTLAA